MLKSFTYKHMQRRKNNWYCYVNGSFVKPNTLKRIYNFGNKPFVYINGVKRYLKDMRCYG